MKPREAAAFHAGASPDPGAFGVSARDGRAAGGRMRAQAPPALLARYATRVAAATEQVRRLDPKRWLVQEAGRRLPRPGIVMRRMLPPTQRFRSLAD